MNQSDERLQTDTYIWSQTEDQVTISFLVPESCKSKDLDIKIEGHRLQAGLHGHPPVFKAKLYDRINHFDSLWQLEKSSNTPLSSLAASPAFSAASSFAFMSTPNQSPNSSMILPAPALTESLTHDDGVADMADLNPQVTTLGSTPSSAMSSPIGSQPSSPLAIATPPTLETPPHLQANASSSSQPPHQHTPKYRILTIHLEKESNKDWVLPISGAWSQDEMDIDIMSANLLGHWFQERMSNTEKAIHYYESAANRGHVPSMVTLALIYDSKISLPHMTGTSNDWKDPIKAFTWYKRAADLDSHEPDPLACYIVGDMYFEGFPEAQVEKDHELALDYYNRTMVNTAPRINIDFGVLDRDCIPKSHLRNGPPTTKEERYFCGAAFQTGLMYMGGVEGDISPDSKLAVRYFKEAALLGHAQAAYNVGEAYASGNGAEKDLVEARRWFSRAHKLNSDIAIPQGHKEVDWDGVQTHHRTHKGRKGRKRRAKSKISADDLDDGFWTAIALGTVAIAAVMGATWWWAHKRRSSS